jgi:hypothetical protein
MAERETNRGERSREIFSFGRPLSPLPLYFLSLRELARPVPPNLQAKRSGRQQSFAILKGYPSKIYETLLIICHYCN